jgi:hypothetical protein
MTIDDHGVPGVIAPRIADDHIGIGRKRIHELALGFVAPLGAYDN